MTPLNTASRRVPSSGSFARRTRVPETLNTKTQRHKEKSRNEIDRWGSSRARFEDHDRREARARDPKRSSSLLPSLISVSLCLCVQFFLAIALPLVGACSSPAKFSPTETAVVEPPKDTRTEIEKRRDAACDQVGDRITQCQLDDAKAQLAAGEVNQKDFDDATTPAALKQFKDAWLKKCQVPMNSYQVRVLEVCHKEETQCGPFYNCLDHLNDKPKDPQK